MPSRFLPVLLLTLLATTPPLAEGVRRLPNEVPFPASDHGRRLSSKIDNVAASTETEMSNPNEGDARAGHLDAIFEALGGDEHGDDRRRAQGADSHLVTSLPLLPPGAFQTSHWAGHIPASPPGSDGKSDKMLFYWLFAPDDGSGGGNDMVAADDKPLVVWLNGGPGCSSMDGLWLENGPFRLTKPSEDGQQWTIEINEHSWHKIPAYVLYIDQPVGTGLSFTKSGDYCKSDMEIDVDFHYFLQEFLLFHGDKFIRPMDDADRSNYPQYASTVDSILRRPLYFTGESHAGHFLPSMMDHILRRQDGALSDGDAHAAPLRAMIPLGGAAIGNGWMDPFVQYASAEAAYGAGLVGKSQMAALDEKERECQAQLKGGNFRSETCFDLLDEVVNESGGSTGRFKVSQYDTRVWEPKNQARTFPMGHKDVETYLGGALSTERPPLRVNMHEVLDAIHASDSIGARQTYRECTDPPYNALAHQDGLGVVEEVVRVLDHPTKPEMLFFNGMNDLICNHVGNEKFLDTLPWSMAKTFAMQPRFAWHSGLENDKPGPNGYMKYYENLSFLKLLDAGHMVPMDQPAVSLDMMRTLVFGGGGKGFAISEQRLNRSDPNKDEKMCSLAMCPGCDVEVPTSVEASSTLPSGLRGPAVVAALSFVVGVLVSFIFQMKKNKSKRFAVGNEDLELSVIDEDDGDGASYSDRPRDAEFT